MSETVTKYALNPVHEEQIVEKMSNKNFVLDGKEPVKRYGKDYIRLNFVEVEAQKQEDGEAQSS